MNPFQFNEQYYYRKRIPKRNLIVTKCLGFFGNCEITSISLDTNIEHRNS